MKELVKVVTHSRPTVSGIYYCVSLGGPVGAQSHVEGRRKSRIISAVQLKQRRPGQGGRRQEREDGDGLKSAKIKTQSGSQSTTYLRVRHPTG